MKLVVTEQARHDQNGISCYTLRRWGREQLIDYVGGLLDRFDEIALDPRLGKSIGGLPARFLRVPYRSHFIFYSLVADEVRIIRILHQRMDTAQHLN